jgi:hypothetical protein
MQTKKKRTETISETETILFIKKTLPDQRGRWCPQCQSEVLWIGPAALHLLGIMIPPESDAIHKSRGDFCSRSLINEIRNGENI